MLTPTAHAELEKQVLTPLEKSLEDPEITADSRGQLLIMSFSLVSYCFKKYHPKTSMSMAEER